MFKKFIAPAIVLASVAVAAPAMAQESAPFTGARVAVTGGWTASITAARMVRVLSMAALPATTWRWVICA